MLAAQGGDLGAPRPRAPAREISAARGGYVRRIDAEKLGVAVIELGGGRKQVHDRIDHSTGLEMLARIGDPVAPGQPIVRVFSPPEKFTPVAELVTKAIDLGDTPTPAPPLIVERIGNE
jgi:thymidine phosphorylase